MPKDRNIYIERERGLQLFCFSTLISLGWEDSDIGIPRSGPLPPPGFGFLSFFYFELWGLQLQDSSFFLVYLIFF